MSKGDHIEVEGVVEDELGQGKYRINPDGEGEAILAVISGRMRHNRIRVIPGDRVKVKVSPYDLTNGIIVRRGR